jgi:uncharacterized phage protein gp47/JayE
MAFPITVIDGNGVSVPLFTDVLVYLQEQYRAIYGSDVDLDPDTQDGQWVSVIASAINDTNMTIAATYLAYSPSYAIGAGLSSVVKINGIRRLTASFSTVVVRCVGQAGTDISLGLVGDNLNLNSQWQLPDGIIIPPEGEITLTATCTTLGAVSADIGTITQILTPVPGWQTVNNDTAAAVIGAPVESDAQLRRRQTQSVANPSQTVVLGIQGAIENLDGVQRVMVYENPTGAPDINGIPAHAMAAVVEGGNAQDVATAIALRKTPGSPTYGSTQLVIYDSRGIPNQISYFQLVLVPITVNITLKALAGFSSAIEQEIVDQVILFLTTLPIGYDCYISKLIAATQLPEPDGLTYDVTTVTQSRDGNTAAAADVQVAFIEAAFCDATLINITVT